MDFISRSKMKHTCPPSYFRAPLCRLDRITSHEYRYGTSRIPYTLGMPNSPARRYARRPTPARAQTLYLAQFIRSPGYLNSRPRSHSSRPVYIIRQRIPDKESQDISLAKWGDKSTTRQSATVVSAIDPGDSQRKPGDDTPRYSSHANIKS